MADKMCRLEFDAYDYVQSLTGKNSVLMSNKQTSVRLEKYHLARIDALAELGNRSRNQIINDALSFGLDLILEQFEKDDEHKYKELLAKQFEKLGSEEATGAKEK
jgi:predicted transcriptional regulator